MELVEHVINFVHPATTRWTSVGYKTTVHVCY